MSDSQLSLNQELRIPEFKSNIPEYILNNIQGTDKEHIKYILETISVIQQQSNWQAEILAKTYAQSLRTNGRVNKLEDNKEKIDEKINKIDEELESNRDSIQEYQGMRNLFNKTWFRIGGVIIGFFIMFFVYPFLLSTSTYKDLILALKALF